MPTAEVTKPKLKYRLPIVAAMGVLLLGLGVTLVMAHMELEHREKENQAHFDQLVEGLRTDVIRRVMAYRYGLMGTRSVFAASNYVDRNEFIDLVAARELESEFPGALGIGYIQRIPDTTGEVQGFVDQVRREGAPWFEIAVPPGAAPLLGSLMTDRYIIKYIEPLEHNRSAHGLDIGSHPVRREAAERALRTNDAALTGTIQLVQDDQKVAGFLYLLPDYTPGLPLDTLEQRAEALRGWVYMPMLGPKVFEGLDGLSNHEVDVHVYDGEALVGKNMIYDADSHLSHDQEIAFEDHQEAGSDYRTTVPIEIGGRTWTLGVRSLPTFELASRSNAWMIVLGGSALSIVFALLVYILGGATRKAVTLAEKMTADLRDYANKAEQATQAKSDFLANMSHEIRTPMTAILGFADLLQQQINEGDKQLFEYSSTIKRNGQHLLSLINDILDMSKIEAGKLDVEAIEVSPQSVISEVLALMRVKAEEQNLPLTATITTPIPEKLQTDPVRLRQVLVNLIGNAIKFTKQGSVRIEVSYDKQTQDLTFAVIDTGIGMTPEQSAKLFQAFAQADSTTTRQFGGTGLGLHISQRLAELLGGTIRYDSTYGQGSTFTLSLKAELPENASMVQAGPVFETVNREQARQRVASTQNTVDELFGNKPPLDGMSILLAEDGKDNQRLINHYLTKAGATVTIVENGRRAVEALAVGGRITGQLLDPPPFDLLLTDMQMPEMDGYTEVRLLREFGSTLPIVALTAHAMKEDVDKCLDAGCDYYASKPINKQKLIDICKQAVSSAPKHREKSAKSSAA